MQLSDEQKQQVATWVSEGASISDVQRRLEEEMKIKLTYLDTRFLVDDLDLTLAEKPRQPEPQSQGQQPQQPQGENGLPTPEREMAPDHMPPPPPQPSAPDMADAEVVGQGGVSVNIDSINVPGTLISGSVSFSDGETATWYIDQTGRVGLKPKTPGYQPSAQDIQEFQAELQAAAQKKGYF